MKKQTKEKSAAILTVHGLGRMNPKGRKDIAEWLRQQAKNFIKDGHLYSDGRFTARYLYKTK